RDYYLRSFGYRDWFRGIGDRLPREAVVWRIEQDLGASVRISRVNSKIFNLDLRANRQPTDADTVNETTVTSRQTSASSYAVLRARRLCSVCFLSFRARLVALRRVLSPFMSKQSQFHYYRRVIWMADSESG